MWVLMLLSRVALASVDETATSRIGGITVAILRASIRNDTHLSVNARMTPKGGARSLIGATSILRRSKRTRHRQVIWLLR